MLSSNIFMIKKWYFGHLYVTRLQERTREGHKTRGLVMFSSALRTNNAKKQTFSPLELENYVKKVQSRLQSPLEKKSKAFAFARLYYDAKDYDTANRYLKDYLSIQDRDFRVYNLLGAVQESLENYEDALTAYKRSLELCSSQKDILIKVIKMCTKCKMDPLRAKVWADKGSRMCPGHPDVFELKWHLLSQEEPKNYEALELLIADELSRQPRDSTLHQKLVQSYLESGNFQKAYVHCLSVQKTEAFDDNIEWLECACDVFDGHQQLKDEEKMSAPVLFSVTLCKLMKLYLRKSDLTICAETFSRFDKTVQKLHRMNPQNVYIGLSTEWKDCLNEMRGQLYLNAAVYLMKLAKENRIPWMKANRMMYVCMMYCWGVSAPSVTPKLFARHSPLKRQSPQAFNWSVLACERLAHAGHVILALESEFGEEWQRNCVDDLCTEQGRNSILDFLYDGDYQRDESFLADDEKYTETEIQSPEMHVLVKYDEVAVAENAEDLHLIIWLGLHWEQLKEQMRPGVGVMVGRLFEGIKMDVKNMKNCHHSTMCLRDVDAFMYAVIRSSKSIHVECAKEEDELKILPLQICTSLVTKAQQEWWQAAYTLYTGKIGNLSPPKLKVVLQKGLETVRCIKDHGIDPRILTYISLAFSEKAETIQDKREKDYDYQEHYKSLQQKSIFYLKEALRILEIFKSNRTMPTIENPLIPPLSEQLLTDQVLEILKKNYMRLGDACIEDGNLQEALKYFEEVKTLQSTYKQAEIYIQLASESNKQTVDGEKNHLYYITKAKEKLTLCISKADDSPDFKKLLCEMLQELTISTMASSSSSANANTVRPLAAKKSLRFQMDIPDADLDAETESIVSNNPLEDVASQMEKSLLKEQLDAKENENRSLKQALIMLYAQVEMQKQNPLPPAPPQAHPQHHHFPQQQQHSQHAQHFPPQHQPHPQQSFPPTLSHSPRFPPHQQGHLQQQNFRPQGIVSPATQDPMLQHHLAMAFTQGPAAVPPQHRMISQGIMSPQTASMLDQQQQVGYSTSGTMTPQMQHPVPPQGHLSGIPPHLAQQHWPRPGTSSYYGSNPMTPHGMETPSDLWWDSFSPQPTFEKGYFAGLAKHVEQVRKETGEGEAPTLRDSPVPFSPSNTDVGTPETSVNQQQQQQCTPNSSAMATPKSPGVVESDDIYVKPIVKLEEKRTDLTTGEEDETLLFVQRAKLYRFDKNTSQWKERGLGDVKLLFNEITKKTRVTMRREQVFSVCCNHFITPEMQLVEKGDTKNTWTWNAPMDASDEEPKPETFAIRFKTEEIAREFFTAFEKCQKLSTGELTEGGPAVVSPLKEQVASTPKDPLVVSSPYAQTNVPSPILPSYEESLSMMSPNRVGTVPKGMIDLSAVSTVLAPAYANNMGNKLPKPATFGYQTAALQQQQQQAFFHQQQHQVNQQQHQVNQQQQPFLKQQQQPFSQYSPQQEIKMSQAHLPNQQQQFNTQGIRQQPSQNSQLANGKPGFFQSMQPVVEDNSKAPVEQKPGPFASFTYDPKSISAPSSQQAAGGSMQSPFSGFSGFSFSSNQTSATVTTAHANVNNEAVPITASSVIQQQTSSTSKEFPMITSLLNEKQQQKQVTSPTSTTPINKTTLIKTPPVSSSATTATKTVIRGMTKLPVFEKGIVDTSVDPSSFWSNISPGRNFFTGNKMGLDSIGHSEPQEAVEDENENDNNASENRKPTENVSEDSAYRNKEYYEDNNEDDFYEGGYYGEDGEYYEDDMDDYDYDPDENFDDEDDYQLSKASSSRKGSDDDDSDLCDFDGRGARTNDKQVEERFDIQKREPLGDRHQIINDEVTITFEKTPTFAQKIKASRLQLPSVFFLYETKPPCPGCKGCKEDYVDTTSQPAQQMKDTTDQRVKETQEVPKVISSSAGFTFGTQQSQPSTGASTFAALASAFGGGSNVGSVGGSPGFGGSKGTFVGAGMQLFGSKSGNDDGSEDAAVDNDYDPHYDAIVQVSKTTVKTGEEDDEILFKHRAKLYRFDSQWKERGVGDIKLTKNVKTGYCRVIMRRDQIHKLCANHAVMPNMDLEPLLTSDTSLVWFTPSDYSDGMPPVPQQFCVKFKHKEITEEFAKQFKLCKEIMVNTLKEQEGKSKADAQTSAQQENNQTSPQGEKVMSVEDEIINEKEKAYRKAESLYKQLKAKYEEKEEQNQTTPTTVFQSPFASFTGFSMTSTSKPTTSSTLTNTPNAPVDRSTVTTTAEEPQSPGYYKEDDPDIHVEAIVQVSKLDALATGEENEEALFEERSKLYRFDPESKVWKERGIGVLKLTRMISQNSCRVVMRREQIHKLCANHAIVQSMETSPLPNSDRAWTWFTQADISDGEPKPDNFCAKFKTPEIAQKFKDTFDRCLEIVGKKGGKNQESTMKKEKEKPTNSFASKFTPLPGAWDCETCSVENPQTAIRCLACETPNPKASLQDFCDTSNANTAETTVTPKPVFSFTSPSGSKIFSNTNEFSSGQKFSSSKFSFGGQNSNSSAFNLGETITHSNSSVFNFGQKTHSTSPTFSFALSGFNASHNNNTSSIGNVPTFASSNAPPSGFGSMNAPSSGFSSNITFDKIFSRATETDETDVEPLKELTSEPTTNIFAKFVKKPGQWECDTCMVMNDKDASQCVACGGTNPNASSNIGVKESQATAPFKFSATSTNNEGGFFFGSNPPSTNSGFSFGSGSDMNATSDGFKFTAISDSSKKAGFLFDSSLTQTSPFTDKKDGKKDDDLFSDELSSTTESAQTAQKLDLKTKFAQPAGSWECPTCMINNKQTDVNCAACQTKNPNSSVTTSEVKSTSTTSVSSQFKFGPVSTQPSGFSFVSDNKTSVSSTVFSFGSESVKTNESSSGNRSGFSFGKPQSSGTSASFTFCPTTQHPPASNTVANEPKPDESNFIPDADAWECICLVKNASKRDVCRTCNAPRQKIPVVRLNPSDQKPLDLGAQEKRAAEKVEAIIVPKSESSSANLFGSFKQVPSASQLPKPDLSNFNNAEKDKDSMPPPIGMIPFVPRQLNKKASPKQESSTFSWTPKGLNSENLFSLGSVPAPSLSNASSVDDLSAEKTDVYKSFASAFSEGTFTFKFDLSSKTKPDSPPKAVTPVKFNISASSPGTPKSPSEEDPTIEFTPLVSLSQIGCQNTGEENDTKLFSERCKMFRFDAGQWKERGVGELKILCNQSTKQHRLVMRREQIHKLCANHLLVEGMDIRPMQGSTRAFLWKTTADISDGEPQEQMLAARFKDEDIAQHFFQVFVSATQSKLDDSNESKPTVCDVNPLETHVISKRTTEDTTECKRTEDVIVISDDEQNDVKPNVDDDNIQLTYESSVSEELRKKTKRFLLPLNFYHIPSVKIGERPTTKTVGQSTSTTMVDSGTMTEVRQRAPDVFLTGEKEPSPEAKHRASRLLLPKAFYNDDDSSLTCKNISITLSDDDTEDSDSIELTEKFTALEHFDNQKYLDSLCDMGAGVYKYSPKNKNWIELENSRVIISPPKEFSRNANLLIVSGDDIFVRQPITIETTSQFRHGFNNMVDVKARDENNQEKIFALSFVDTFHAELFRSKFDEARDQSPKQQYSFGSLFGTSNGMSNPVSFASLAGNTQESGFHSNAGHSFAGAGTTLFGKKPSEENDNDENGDNGTAVENDSNYDVYVEPIVQLMGVAVSSGEEKEDAFFNERCKLYRFDSKVKKWKERGVGEVKLLRDRDTRKARLVMRREQVHKVCANHSLIPTMKLEPFGTNELTVTWTAYQDVSEEQPEDALLAAKFKNIDILTNFKTVFEKLCTGDDDLQAISTVYEAEEGSQYSNNLAKEQRIGACDPKLATLVKKM